MHFSPGFIGGGLRIPGAQLAYHNVDTNHTANHSWTATLGTAVDGNDFFVIAISCGSSSLSSATLGGNSLGAPIASIGNVNIFLISAAGYGSSATLNANFGLANFASVIVWRMTHANSSPVVNSSSTAGPFSVSVLKNYMVLVNTAGVTASSATITISGVAQDFSEGTTPTALWQAGAHALQGSSGTLGVSISYGGATAVGANILAFKGHI